MKITTVIRKEWDKEYLEKTDIKQLVFEFESGVLKDLEIIKMMLNQLHTDIKVLIERIEKYENSKAETANTPVDP